MTEISNKKSTRWIIFLLVLFVWAGIYLPGLGQQELKGNEGLRILPAVTMLKTGDWVRPYIGGVPYNLKPPMINWLVAASFILSGQHDEWAARLPSVLSVLGFVCLVVWLPGAWLSVNGRLIASVMFLTTVALIEKGRLIEIEAVHISLTSIAVFLWLSAWMTGRSRWWLWLAPVPFLATGMLTKGPVILYFYYVTVLCILAYTRRMRALVSIPHGLAVILTLGVPAIWAYLAWQQTGPEQMAGGMSGMQEIGTRMMPWNIEWGPWTKDALKSVFILLPWVLLAPVLWQRFYVCQVPEEQLPAFKGARLGLLLGFAIITLIPGNSSRYGMPAMGLGSVLLGMILGSVRELPDRGRGWRISLLVGFALASVAVLAGLVAVNRGFLSVILAVAVIGVTIVVFRRRERFQRPAPLSIFTGLLVVILMLQYALFALPIIRKGEARRPLAAQINALVPDGETLYVFNPDYQAFLFYVREPLDYLVRPDQIDRNVRYLLIRENAFKKLSEGGAFGSRPPTVRYEATYRKKGDFLLLELAPGTKPSGPNSQAVTSRRELMMACSGS